MCGERGCVLAADAGMRGARPEVNPTRYTVWEWCCWRWRVLTYRMRHGGEYR